MKPAQHQRLRTKPARRGSALVVALTTLLIAMLISGLVFRSLLSVHRQSRTSLQQLQAHWLAEGAAERACSQLQASSAYAGETWRPLISPASGGDAQSGVAEIRVERPADSKQVHVTVDVRFPDDPWQRASVQRSFEFAEKSPSSPNKNENQSSQEKAP